MRHVVFITPTLHLGGAERALVKAVTALRPLAARMDIIVLTDCSTSMVSELPVGIGLHVLGCTTSANPLGWVGVRKLLKAWSPQAVVGWSTYANFVAIVSTWRLPIPTLIVCERNYIPKMLAATNAGMRRALLVRLMKGLYRRADIVTANSADGVRFLRKFIGPGPRYAQLPNNINVDEALIRANRSPEIVPDAVGHPRLLAIGRLQPQKGFDLLLEALARVRASCPWHLVLVGDGPEKTSLQTLAHTLGLDDAVQWIGAVANPFPYYRWADLVIVPSRFEGFPNVALEAMSCARTVICSDCRTGPKELTQNGRFGVLVPSDDVVSLAKAILDWGRDADGRRRMGERACDHVRTRYDSGRLRQIFSRALSCPAGS
ncbi:MAG TPA: glycosyltransferase [Nitrospira sp.]|nr:glycosyltransferase [Nitrospira sp.]